MGSVSQSAAPISDIKPTLNESPTSVFNNQSKTLTGSNSSESLLGDSANFSNTQKSISTYGDSLSGFSKLDKSINYTLGQNASITDGGAIGAMFQITKQVLESQQKNVIDTVKEAKKETDKTKTATELKDKFLEFYKNNKAAVILAAAAAGWLIYKGVKS